MTDKISKWEEEARLAEEKAKELKRKIRLEKKAQQEKLALAIGSAVLSATDVKSVAEFEEKYLANSSDFSNGSIIDENQMVIEKSRFEALQQEVNLSKQLQVDLNKIADGMEWNGSFWKVNNLPKVSEWLANFRTGK